MFYLLAYLKELIKNKLKICDSQHYGYIILICVKFFKYNTMKINSKILSTKKLKILIKEFIFVLNWWA
jgi:hypothetical protein